MIGSVLYLDGGSGYMGYRFIKFYQTVCFGEYISLWTYLNKIDLMIEF